MNLTDKEQNVFFLFFWNFFHLDKTLDAREENILHLLKGNLSCHGRELSDHEIDKLLMDLDTVTRCYLFKLAAELRDKVNPKQKVGNTTWLKDRLRYANLPLFLKRRVETIFN